MPYVVTDACIQCKYTDCVSVCPMDCFFEGPNFLVIHPQECIDCSICVAECPVGAIISEQDLRPDQAIYADLNRELSQAPGWTRISRQKDPLPDHEYWAGRADKLGLLERP